MLDEAFLKDMTFNNKPPLKKITRPKARFFDINTHAPINISWHYS